MTGRQMALAWAIAIGVTAFCVVLLQQASSRGYALACPGGAASLRGEAVVIGSSLSRSAFAASDPQVPPPLAAHLWTVSNLGAGSGLALIRCAAQKGADTIFVEANTFVFGPNAGFSAGQSTWQMRLEAQLQSFSAQLYFFPRLANFALGKRIIDPAAAPFDGRLPDHPRWPRSLLPDALAERLEQIASAYPAKVFLFEPPRTLPQRAAIGEDFGQDPGALLQAFAQRAQVPVLEIWPGWENDYFVDYYSHLSTAGRARFLAEFQAAWDRVRDAD